MENVLYKHRIKNRITQLEYQELLIFFHIEEEHKTRSYYYFDTSADPKKALLLKRKIRLGIRAKNNKYRLSFKIPGSISDPNKNHQEYRLELSKNDVSQIFIKGKIPKSILSQKINDVEVQGPFTYIGTCYSRKVKKKFFGIKLILDKTFFPSGLCIYELEVCGVSEERVNNFFNIISNIIGLKRRLGGGKMLIFWNYIRKLRRPRERTELVA